MLNKYITIIFFFVITSIPSCLLLNNQVYKIQYYPQESMETIRGSKITLLEVNVIKDFDYQKIQNNAEYIFKILFASREVINQDDSYNLYAVFKEEKFIRNNIYLNSITLEITVINSKYSRPAFYILFSEETSDSLTSYPYLYKLINKGISKVLN